MQLFIFRVFVVIEYVNKKVRCVQIDNRNTPIEFNGLSRVMSRRITVNPEYYKELNQVYTREKGSVGSLPRDLFELFKSESKEVNRNNIAGVKETLNEANKILQGIEELKIEIGRNSNVNNLINAFLPKIAKLNIQPERIPRIISEIRKRFTPDKQVLAEFSEKAGAVINKRFQEIGILKESERAEVSYIDQGKYKNTFKLRLLDKDNNDIIHPKVILSFKPEKTSMEQTNVILSLMKTYFQNIKPKDYLKTVTNILDHASVKVVPPQEKEIYRKSLLDIYSKMKTKNEEDKFMALIEKAMLDEIKYNGVGPESNITQFIKRSAGHPMKASDYIDVFYLNTIDNVGLSELSDKALPKATKKINLHKYGLFHDDLLTNKNNEVEGRVIDYGGIKPLKGMAELSENRVARRYYHKLSQISNNNERLTQKMRVDYWNNLYEKAQNASIPNHNDVLLALQKGKSLISPEYWHLLSDVKTSL